jgi:hypothetical protein
MDAITEILEGVPSDLFAALWEAKYSRRGTLRFTPNPAGVDFLGEQHGKARAVGHHVVPGLGQVLTVHMEGRKHFAGRGCQNYSGAQYRTVLLSAEALPNGARRYIDLGDTLVPTNTEAREATHTSIVQAIR